MSDDVSAEFAAVLDGRTSLEETKDFLTRSVALMSRTICGVSDGVTRSSSARKQRGCLRALARETGRVGLALRSELHQRRQNDVFI